MPKAVCIKEVSRPLLPPQHVASSSLIAASSSVPAPEPSPCHRARASSAPSRPTLHHRINPPPPRRSRLLHARTGLRRHPHASSSAGTQPLLVLSPPTASPQPPDVSSMRLVAMLMRLARSLRCAGTLAASPPPCVPLACASKPTPGPLSKPQARLGVVKGPKF